MFVDARKNPQVMRAHDREVHRIDYAKAQLAERYMKLISNAGNMRDVTVLISRYYGELADLEPWTPVGRFARWITRLVERG